jgi:DNA-binding response OmpR family regulator
MTTILIIDDDDQFRNMLKKLLEEEGYQVFEASDGEKGLKVYREHPVDLIMLDIFMPNKDGLETIQDLKRDVSDTKILAMSGGGRRGGQWYLEYAGMFGANTMLTKPFNPPELFEAIRQLLEE